MPWPSDQTPNTKKIQHLVKEKSNSSGVASLEKWQQVDSLAATCILQGTGKETLVRGDFSPCMFLKSHWTCPSKFKLSCYNPQRQEEALVFKDSGKQNIPSTSESKKESPGERWNAIKNAQTYTHTNTKYSHTGYLPAVYMYKISFMTAQTVASIIWFEKFRRVLYII